jgi:hypothetical protein
MSGVTPGHGLRQRTREWPRQIQRVMELQPPEQTGPGVDVIESRHGGTLRRRLAQAITT